MPIQSVGQVCFVMTPFGEAGSETRRDSDRIVDAIVKPAVEKFGYLLARSDTMDSADSISKDLMLRLADAPLAIANLTGKNAAVFYGLAFRHTLEKPVILICAKGETLPFDPGMGKVIWFDLGDEESLARCSEDIIRHIEANRETPKNVDNPLATMMDLQQLHANTPFTMEDVQKAFAKLPDFNERPYDLRILFQRLRQNNITTKGQLAELMSRGILDTIRMLYREELYRREDNLFDHEGVAVWGSYFVNRGVTADTIARVRKAMTGFPEYQRTHGDLFILEARYGANNTWRDVTDILRSEIRESRLELWVLNETFRRKFDPSRWEPEPGTPKHLEVHYAYRNKFSFKDFFEGEKLILPLL